MRLWFERGTLRLDGERLPGFVWDERVAGFRSAAYRYAHVRNRVREDDDEVARAFLPAHHRWRRPELRDYQEDALAAWRGSERRGLVALPTGSGKTRVAIAALAEVGGSAVILCPTRALVEQWREELARWYEGNVGVVSDGVHRVHAVTVMTFDSAWRCLDLVGDRFQTLVVDEVHHFSGGARAEALETCAAPFRLGLTATAPRRGTPEHARLEDLVGPIVCEVGIAALVGKHLAPLDLVKLRVHLEDDEADEYESLYQPFDQRRRAFFTAHPGAEWSDLLRMLAKTEEGRLIADGYRRAVAIASMPRAKRAMAASLLRRHWDDKKLVFTALTDHAYRLSREHLVPVITAEVKKKEREEILSFFKDGRYKTIVSARVLNEGIDVPDARVAILLAGSLGAREHVQRLGRVLRPAPDKRAVAYEIVTADTLDDGRSRARWRTLAADQLAFV
jgi:superfamily II DNA or RNA helicase